MASLVNGTTNLTIDPNHGSIDPESETINIEEEVYKDNWFYGYLPYRIFVTYFLETTCPLAFSAFGIFSNILNIIVFYRQGPLSDSCTPSLLGLALSDLCNCTLRFLSVACVAHFAIVFVGNSKYAAPPIRNPATLSHFLVKGASYFTTTTCWITFYIGLERMISVLLPFHVKRIFTAKRSYFIIGFIFVAFLLVHLPDLLSVELISWKAWNGDVFWVPIYYRLISAKLRYLFIYIKIIYLRPICLSAVVLFNTVIILKVKTASRFRKSTTTTTKATTEKTSEKYNNIEGAQNSLEPKKGSEKNDKKSLKPKQPQKEDKLTKMMVFLSLFLVFCMIPGMVHMAMAFRLQGRIPIPLYAHWILENSMILLEAVNSSCNILIYYTMSGKFKKEISQMFGSCKSKLTK